MNCWSLFDDAQANFVSRLVKIKGYTVIDSKGGRGGNENDKNSDDTFTGPDGHVYVKKSRGGGAPPRKRRRPNNGK